ncbi:hypothetical protein D3C80_1327600 [compost metagenome]
MIAEFAGPVIDLGMNLRLVRVRAAHDVAVDVTTGRQCGHQCVINSLDCFFEIPFKYTMHLKSLSGRQTQSTVAVFVSQLIHYEPLRR